MRNIFFTDESVKINWFNSENLTDSDLESTLVSTSENGVDFLALNKTIAVVSDVRVPEIKNEQKRP